MVAQMRWLAQLRLKFQVCQTHLTKRLLLSLSQPLLKPVWVVAPGTEGPAIEPPPVVVDIGFDGLPSGPAAAPRPAGVARRGRFGAALQLEIVLCTLCGEEARQFQLVVCMPWQ